MAGSGARKGEGNGKAADDMLNDEDHYNNLKTFLLDLDIDTPNVVDLMRCTLEHREQIMDTFSPENSDDSVEEINISLNKMVLEFLKGEASEPSGGEGISDPLQQFAQKFGLNRNAILRLQGLPADAFEHTLETFAPPAGTRDMSAKLISYVRKFTRQRHEQKHSNDTEGADPLDRFARKWGLDERALNRLRDLPPDSLDTVIQKFAPPASTRDMNAKLMFFVKRFIEPQLNTATADSERFATGGLVRTPEDNGAGDACEAFAEKWGLNEIALERLRGLPAEVATEKMDAFAPPAGTRDMSGKFLSFLKVTGSKQRETPRSPRKRALSDVAQDDPLDEFVRHWGLTDIAVERLRALPEDALNEAMDTFKPPADTRDVSAKLVFFVNNYIDTDFFEESTRMPEFVEKWELTENAVRRLRRLETQLQDEVIESFAPAADTRDVHSKLMAFIKAKQTHPGKGTGKQPRNDRTDRTAAGPLELFAEKWSLHEESMQRLNELSNEQQDHVLVTFAPRDTSRDVNALFLSFLRRAGEKGSGKSKDRDNSRPHADRHSQPVDAFDPVNSFAQKWELNQEAVDRLIELPMEMQDELMASFSPGYGTRDVSTKFMAFVKSKARSRQGQPGAGSGGGGGRGGAAVEEFAQRWQLTDDAFQQLCALPVDVAEKAMATFKPGPNTRDMSARFLGFVKRSILTGQGGRQSQHFAEQVHPLDRFADQWGLSQMAMDRLLELPEEQQDEVIATFAPREDTKDINGRFIAFLRTRLKGGGKGDRHREQVSTGPDPGSFRDRWGLSQPAMDRLFELPVDQQNEAMASFAPRDDTKDTSGRFIAFLSGKFRTGGKGSKGSSGGKHARQESLPSSSEANDFAQRWGLDDQAVQFLLELPGDQQREVIHTFKPRDSTRDCSRLFMSFAKSLNGEAPRKRARHD